MLHFFLIRVGYLYPFEIVDDREVVVTHYKSPPNGAAYRSILVQGER